MGTAAIKKTGNGGIVIPYSFPSLRDVTRPLGEKIPPNTNGPGPNGHGIMTSRRSFTTMS